MRNSMALGAVVLAMVLCGGCGEEKLDASSEDAFKKSVDAVKKPLDSATAAKFDKSVQGLMMTKVVLSGGVTDEASMRAKMKEVFHGKTASQIIAEGEKVSADAKAGMEKLMKE